MEKNIALKLIGDFEKAITERNIAGKKFEQKYPMKDNKIPESMLSEYQKDKEEFEKTSEAHIIEAQAKIADFCGKVRALQPELENITEKNLNIGGRMPKSIALGKYHIKYANFDERVPHLFPFPFEKPMYVADEEQIKLIQKIIMRLMYALPIDKQEYYIFDPINLGGAVSPFRPLFSNENFFPQKKIMVSAGELKKAMAEVFEYARSVIATSFDDSRMMYDWESYNTEVAKTGDMSKLLSYKVFVFLDVPMNMDQECFDYFKKLIHLGKKCGFLVLYSFNKQLLEAADSKNNRAELELRECIEQSLPLHEVMGKTMEDVEFENLTVECVGEGFPGTATINTNMIRLYELLKERSKSMYTFKELLQEDTFHSGDSTDGLEIPVGYTTSGGREVCMEIGNATPHFLVGGITGSGKSNFLHNMIMSACWRYSPDELLIYLLDFKEGVEFKIYADRKLPNARLVATEADTEYGVKVLEHLDKERERRYKLFKSIPNCKDIQTYRNSGEGRKMPRILIVIDEFQRLFENAQKQNTIEQMVVLAKQGRACGIHMVLSTQTLKGLDFSDIATQFGGRIALKCSAEDSKMLLGGITTGNEAASEITIPFAIMNVAQGNPADNQKFIVTEAMRKGDNTFNEKLDHMAETWQKEGEETGLKVFEGQAFPEYPGDDMFVSKPDEVDIVLGEALDYEADRFNIKLEDQFAENVFVCCRDRSIKRQFIKMSYMSAVGCEKIDEFIYVGGDAAKYGDLFSDSKATAFSDIVDFINSYKDKWFDSKKLLLIDNVNLSSIGFPPSQTYIKNENKDKFIPFWNECCKYGSHILAIYETASVSDRGLSLDIFCHRIGFGTNNDDMNRILSNRAPKANGAGRAFYANNLEVEAWFRPFVEKKA